MVHRLNFIGSWFMVIITLVVMVTACEKANLGGGGKQTETETEPTNGHRLKIVATLSEGLDDNEAAAAVGDVCSRVSYCVFTADGKVYKTWHQGPSDAHRGTYTIALPEGNYLLAVIAHSGEGNVSCESAQSIKFKNNKITDTFCAYKQINVSGDADCSLALQRAVAMVQVHITGAMPTGVDRMEFYYTGGSSTLSALTGYGSVNSRQTEHREVTANMVGKASQFDIFTFPHQDSGNLRLTIRSLDKEGTILHSQVCENISITRNVRTSFSTPFFSGTPGDDDTPTPDLTINFEADDAPITGCY